MCRTGGPDVENACVSSTNASDTQRVEFQKLLPHFTDTHIETSAPQSIRVNGFHQVLDQFSDRLAEISCNFGANKKVFCACDPMHGTIECSVPTSTISADNVLVVKACIGEYESPPLTIRYSAQPVNTRNVLFHADDDDDDMPNRNSQPDGFHSRMLSWVRRDGIRHKNTGSYLLLHQCIAECIGTMLIVVFGVGSVCSAVTMKSDVALWHIATVWGFGIALAIHSSASVSGAHLNPAVSLAFALFRPNDFSFHKLIPYWIAQYAGGIIGGAFNLLVFGPAFKRFETRESIVRGSAESLFSAKAFGEYFPDPGGLLEDADITPAFAMLVEAWGTALLMFIILVLTDPRHRLIRNKEMLPFYIGFTVAVLIAIYAPITQAGWNPARDFGPRVVAALAGWGKVAIPGPRYGFWVYIIGPKIGAPLGALVYDLLINPGLTDHP